MYTEKLNKLGAIDREACLTRQKEYLKSIIDIYTRVIDDKYVEEDSTKLKFCQLCYTNILFGGRSCELCVWLLDEETQHTCNEIILHSFFNPSRLRTAVYNVILYGSKKSPEMVEAIAKRIAIAKRQIAVLDKLLGKEVKYGK